MAATPLLRIGAAFVDTGVCAKPKRKKNPVAVGVRATGLKWGLRALMETNACKRHLLAVLAYTELTRSKR